MAATRRPWFDPRLILGLILVVASVLGVTWLVSAADRTQPVFTASAMLLPGDVVTAADLQVAQVRLGSVGSGYLAPGDIPEDGLLVVRVIAAGELIPASALADTAELDRTAVVVTLHSPLPQSVTAGRTVELWASPVAEFGRYGAPALIAGDVLLLRAVDSEGMFDASSASVELLVPRAALDAVLAAVANGDALAVIAASGLPPVAPGDGAEGGDVGDSAGTGAGAGTGTGTGTGDDGVSSSTEQLGDGDDVDAGR